MFATNYQIGFSTGGGAVVAPTVERTRFVVANSLAEIPVGADGDQATVIGGLLRGVVMENVAGVLTYRGQQQVIRTTIMPPVQREAIGDLLPVGEVFWYYLANDDGTNQAGWYRVDDDGISAGPVKF